MFDLPAWLTYQQFEVLKRIVPGHPVFQPLGQGMTQQMAANDMGVHLSTVKRIIDEIKTKFPSAWERVGSMQRAMNRQLVASHTMRSLDNMVVNVGHSKIYEETDEVF
ncbi:hypothetical protein LCGC14_1408890 [marine sediment metagenome]|uniref:Uncharacterized protein n=1 Tax=marine sediment metagenome TaxID=412755 RepID=A0A0F9JUW8_9ZZZZ